MKAKWSFMALFFLMSLQLTAFINIEVKAAKVVPYQFSTIQKAINAANPGDIIYVRAGIYYENIVINKSITLVGENKTTTIIDGNHDGDVILITAQNVTITGFTIRHSGQDSSYAGIKVKKTYTIIQDNIFQNTACGIYVDSVGYTKIGGNEIFNASYAGIMLYLAYSVNMTCNEIFNCRKSVDLDGVENIKVAYNNVSYSNDTGIYLTSFLGSTSDIYFIGNNIIFNDYGIKLIAEKQLDEKEVTFGAVHITNNTIRCNNIGFYQMNATGFFKPDKVEKSKIYHNNFIEKQ